jgi:hypothetical protein
MRAEHVPPSSAAPSGLFHMPTSPRACALGYSYSGASGAAESFNPGATENPAVSAGDD